MQGSIFWDQISKIKNLKSRIFFKGWVTHVEKLNIFKFNKKYLILFSRVSHPFKKFKLISRILTLQL